MTARPTTTQRGYGIQHQHAASQVIADHVRLYGYWCPGDPDYDHAIHPTRDLVADHVVAGDPTQGLRVCCRPLNTRRMMSA